MKKIFIFPLIILSLFLTIFASDYNYMFLDGKKCDSSISPITQYGITYLPLRTIGENLGYDVTWNAIKKTATLKKGTQKFTINTTTNDYTFFDNKGQDRHTPLSEKPIFKKNRLLIPAEFFSVMLNTTVTKDANGFSIKSVKGNTIYGIITQIDDKKIVISPKKDSDLQESTILNINDMTILNPKQLKVGDNIIAITSHVYTRNLPLQTDAYTIYKTAQPTATVGRILSFDADCLNLLMGDVVISYYLDESTIKNYFVGQMVELNEIGVNTLIKPYLIKNFKREFTNMGEKITTITGKLTAFDDRTITIKDQKNELTFDCAKQDFKIGDTLMVRYFVINESKIILTVINTDYRYTLTVEKIERSKDGNMILTAIDKSNKRFTMLIDQMTKLNINLSKIVKGSQIIVYTDIVIDLLPNQLRPILVEAIN